MNEDALESLLRAAISAGPADEEECTLLFAGDSVSHDAFIAAFAGAMGHRMRNLLHFQNCEWLQPPCKPGTTCSDPRPPYSRQPSLCNTSANHGATIIGRAKQAGPTASSFTFAVAPSARRPHAPASCKQLTIQHAFLASLASDPSFTSALLSGGPSVTIVINQGLWANRATELTSQLDTLFKPLLTIVTAIPSRQRATLLWRETTPQHFMGRSGTGLYAERTGSSSSSGRVACGPIRESSDDHVRKANWRNVRGRL